MDPQNPYAAPLAETYAKPVEPMGGIYCDHDGRTLVIHKSVDFPPEICVMTNGKAAGTLRRKLSWHPPAVYLALLANLLIYVVLAIIFTKKADLNIGLSEEWFRKRRFRMIGAWVGSLTAIGLFILSLTLLDARGAPEALGPLMLVGSILLFVVSLVTGAFSARMIHATRITDKVAFIRGVSPEFAQRFPRWTGEP